MGYDHTQRSRWIVAPLLFVVLGLAVAIVFAGMPAWLRIALGLVALVYYWLLDTFGRLRVRVEGGVLTVSFGRGWPRRMIALDQVVAVAPRRAKWWYGWGIRRIPSGWLWNVSGLDYVEFRMNGRTFSVGTDEPDSLVAATSPWIRR